MFPNATVKALRLFQNSMPLTYHIWVELDRELWLIILDQNFFELTKNVLVFNCPFEVNLLAEAVVKWSELKLFCIQIYLENITG